MTTIYYHTLHEIASFFFYFLCNIATRSCFQRPCLCYEVSQWCISRGVEFNAYDGYRYYCRPDFGFTCSRCGYGQTYHRTESGLCYDWEGKD